MRHHVSYEMAVKLKRTGFPQPNTQFGQLWETQMEHAFVGTGQFELFRQHCMKDAVFTPTAIDIMREMFEYSIRVSLIGWEVVENETGVIVSTHKEPAECAAIAWLKLNAA